VYNLAGIVLVSLYVMCCDVPGAQLKSSTLLHIAMLANHPEGTCHFVPTIR